jgi:hypothetical protein
VGIAEAIFAVQIKRMGSLCSQEWKAGRHGDTVEGQSVLGSFEFG